MSSNSYQLKLIYATIHTGLSKVAGFPPYMCYLLNTAHCTPCHYDGWFHVPAGGFEVGLDSLPIVILIDQSLNILFYRGQLD